MTQTFTVTVTPTMDTSIYAAGDLWFDCAEIQMPGNARHGSWWLTDIQVIDKDDQALQSFDLFFTDTTVDFGTLNSAPSITDANALFIQGRVRLDGTATPPAGIDLGGSKLYSKSSGDPPLPLAVRSHADTPTKLYVAGMIVSGTPTNTASGVVIRLTFSHKV